MTDVLRPDDPDDSPVDAVLRMVRPEWVALDPKQLQLLLGRLCLEAAKDPDSVPPEDFEELFKLLGVRLTVKQREGIINGLNQLVLQGVPARVLIPFVFYDLDEAVISKAALDYSVLRKPDEVEGPFAGPRLLLDTVAAEPEAADYRRAATLAGVVLLGDRRLLPYLRGCWNWLGEEGRAYLAAATSDGVIKAGQVDFLLEWLEQTQDQQNFGGILGTLCRMPFISPDGRIHDVERAFPVLPGQPPFRVLRSWTFPEYYECIRDRLARLTEREAEPKLTPQLENYWCDGNDGPPR
jgi:hypothetical protein